MIVYNIAESDIENVTACPVCGSLNLERVAKVTTKEGLLFFSTESCSNCRFVLRGTRPTKKWFSDAFVERENQQKKLNINPINLDIEKERYDRYKMLAENLIDTIGEGAGGLQVLDIGCGPGTGMQAFIDCGFECEGLDEDQTRAGFGVLNGLKIQVSQWENYTPLKSFDIITLLHSVEHFHDPAVLLKRIIYWLKPGGKLVIEVPNFKYFVTDWTDALYLAHMANYSPFNLSQLAVSCGYPMPKRLKYYESVEKNDKNLCLIFDLGKGTEKNSLAEEDEVDEDFTATVYRQGLTGLSQTNEVLEFVIPCINDISLGYKNSGIISNSLQENLHMRNAVVIPGTTKILIS